MIAPASSSRDLGHVSQSSPDSLDISLLSVVGVYPAWFISYSFIEFGTPLLPRLCKGVISGERRFPEFLVHVSIFSREYIKLETAFFFPPHLFMDAKPYETWPESLFKDISDFFVKASDWMVVESAVSVAEWPSFTRRKSSGSSSTSPARMASVNPWYLLSYYFTDFLTVLWELVLSSVRNGAIKRVCMLYVYFVFVFMFVYFMRFFVFVCLFICVFQTDFENQYRRDFLGVDYIPLLPLRWMSLKKW